MNNHAENSDTENSNVDKRDTKNRHADNCNAKSRNADNVTANRQTPIILDINCDMGESFGAYVIGNDEQLFAEITSANIACGFHAGDPGVMRRAVQGALRHGVAIGAHPGLPDLVGFGRRHMNISPQEAYDLVTYQLGALHAFVSQEGGKLHHVKPHGALYNMAAVSRPLADHIARAVAAYDSDLILYGLSGSLLIQAGQEAGLQVASEVFADRTYQSDGTLTPRQQPDALIDDTAVAVEQIIHMLTTGTVRAVDGTQVSIQADTVCIHGDGAHAVTFARELNKCLCDAGVQLSAPSILTGKEEQA
ncbi:LamB/YcsF family protein [Paenibacillus sp. WLX2291]|uniref:LamB/YcsF family protein n=1 Tax=Paenibacillus sp. WLX2291 TaxID=3296934 RepID=UPI003983ECA4